MKHIIDGCGKGEETSLKNVDCEKCLEILHKRAAQEFLLAYEFLCDVKWWRYEAAFKAVNREIDKKKDDINNSEAWKEAISVDME